MPSDGTPRSAEDGRFLLHALAAASVPGLCAGPFLGMMPWD